MHRIALGVRLQNQNARSFLIVGVLFNFNRGENRGGDFVKQDIIGHQFAKAMQRCRNLAIRDKRFYAFEKIAQFKLMASCYSAAFSFFAAAFSGARPLSRALRYCPV